MARRRAPGIAPAALLREVRSRAGSGWPAGLAVLTGDDAYHLDAAQDAILAALVPPGTGDLALTVFGGDERVAVADVVAAARSVGMFSPRRVVLVRDVDVLEGEPDALQAYAGRPPADSYLVVRAPALDQRRKLHKALASAGTTLAFVRGGEADDPATRREIGGLAAERGLRLRPAVVAFLAEAAAGDLYRVRSELDKIRAWIGGDTPADVTPEIAREVAAGTAVMTGWEVADAVQRRDLPEALAALRRLIESGAEPIQVLGGLAWRARALLQARALRDGGAGPRDILSAVRVPFAREAFLEAVERYSLAELRAFPYHLARADRTLKSRGIDAGAVLQELAVALISPSRTPSSPRAPARGATERR